jgi:hypothetical protein
MEQQWDKGREVTAQELPVPGADRGDFFLGSPSTFFIKGILFYLTISQNPTILPYDHLAL